VRLWLDVLLLRLTAKSEELRALAQRLTDGFPPEVIEVVLTGSVSRTVPTSSSRSGVRRQRSAGAASHRAGLPTVTRDDTALARVEWLVEAAQRTLQIVFAVNRVHRPTAKRLSSRLEALVMKPERTAERIESTLADPDPRRALLTMTELQLDTLALAPSGPNVDRAHVWLEACASLLRRPLS
jgi:hypothetical protein